MLADGRPPAPKPEPRKPAVAQQAAATVTRTAESILDAVRGTTPSFDPAAVSDTRAELAQKLREEATRSYTDSRNMHAPSWYTVPQDQPATSEDVQTELAGALRRQREEALGTQRPERPIRKQVDQMTQAEYDALTEQQRAAVDFNTMLVGAVRKDRKMADEYNPNKTQQATYDRAVEKMFGADGGSDTFAPETLALLQQIKFSDQSADLDDFLGLKAAIREKDLQHIVPAGAPATVGGVATDSPAADRIDLSRTLAQQTAGLEATLAKGNELLSTITKTASADRRADMLGGYAQPEPKQILGYGTGEVDRYFQTAFEALANKESGFEWNAVMADATAQLHPDELDAFMAYVKTRSGNAERFGTDLGSTEGGKYRTPEKLQELLTAGKGARRAR